MGFSTQILFWSVVVGVAVVAAVVPRWRGEPVGRAASAGLAATGGLSILWIASEAFFAQLHIIYLLVTVVPACVVVAAVATAGGRRWLRTARGAAVAVALSTPPILGAYATHVEPYWLRVEHVDVVADGGALRVGVLADLQTPGIGDHERNARTQLLEQRPDVILIPGDLWQTTDEAIEEQWPIWADYVAEMVDAVEHVAIVEGDTDHIGWIELIGERTGAIVVHDRVETLTIDGVTVAIGGTQLVSGRPPLASVKAMEELVALESDEVVTIALAHRPDIVGWLPGEVDLVVSGHTHGGQVQVPFFGPIITQSDVPRSVAAGGLHEVDGQTIYVSTGVGLERRRAPQVRFNARPSIGILDLVAGPRFTD